MKQFKLITILIIGVTFRLSSAEFSNKDVEAVTEEPTEAEVPAETEVPTEAEAPADAENFVSVNAVDEHVPFEVLIPETKDPVKCLVLGEGLECAGKSNVPVNVTGVNVELNLPNGQKHFNKCKKNGKKFYCSKKNTSKKNHRKSSEKRYGDSKGKSSGKYGKPSEHGGHQKNYKDKKNSKEFKKQKY